MLANAREEAQRRVFQRRGTFGSALPSSPASPPSSSLQFSHEDRQMLRNTIEKYVSAFQCQRVNDVFPMFIQNKLAECVAHAIASEGRLNVGQTFSRTLAGILVNTNSGGDDTNTSDNEDKKTRAAFFENIGLFGRGT